MNAGEIAQARVPPCGLVMFVFAFQDDDWMIVLAGCRRSVGAVGDAANQTAVEIVLSQLICCTCAKTSIFVQTFA